MKTKFFVFLSLFYLLFPVRGFTQSRNGDRVAIYIDPKTSSVEDNILFKDIRVHFLNILVSNGFEVAPDSIASRMASEYRKSNWLRIEPVQNLQKKPVKILYKLSLDKYGSTLKLLVSEIDIEGRFEPKSGQSNISDWLLDKNQSHATKLLTYEMASSLGLISTGILQSELDKLRGWKDKMEKNEQETSASINRQYAVLSFLPPVNQFRSHTLSGRNNGIAILAGYGISVGSFIGSTVSYKANKRKYENSSIGLTEDEKAKELYKKQMDLCRGGQIASSALLVGSYIYGVVNAFANKDNYQNNPNMAIAPTAYDYGGAGLALVIKF